ncbi:MAG TPA: ribosome maturation factor RimM [Ruania sp.]|nr:ribosome maturation factor RimM [Ruania sp.]
MSGSAAGGEAGVPDAEVPEVRIATVGAPHGLSGQVRLRLHTDNPQERLARGVRLRTDPPEAGPLTVAMVRRAQDQWYAKFEGITDRTAAEGLRGLLLWAAEDTGEPEAWYPRQLRGLPAQDRQGTVLGVIEDIQHFPAQDALVLREESGRRTLIPFVQQIVPEVDVPRRVVLDPPPGLLAGEDAGLVEESDEVSPAETRPDGSAPADATPSPGEEHE